MTKYVALLRAVNVGGTGKLPMSELVAMCRDAGFAEVETYIACGSGMGRSKLRIPVAKAGTARNMNTVAKLAALAAK